MVSHRTRFTERPSRPATASSDSRSGGETSTTRFADPTLESCLRLRVYSRTLAHTTNTRLERLRVVANPLRAEFVPLGASGELTARFEHSIDTLVIEAARPTRSWPFGTTLDGALTLDLDSEHRLEHADLMSKRNRWKRGALSLPERAAGVRAIRLPNLSTDALAGERVQVAPIFDGTTVAIWIGLQEADRRTPLGLGVDALIRSSTLVGLTVEGI
jgi:hypothetical protein